MQFLRSADPSLYVSDGPDARSLFLLAAGTADAPAALSPADAWSGYRSGVFVFVPNALASGQEGPFVAAARRALAEPGLANARMVWFQNVDDALPLVGVTRPPAVPLRGTAIGLLQGDDASGTTCRTTRFEIRNLTLFVGMGCRVTRDPATGSFRIARPAGDSSATRLVAEWGTIDLPILGDDLTITANGRLRVTVRARAEQAGRPSDLVPLGVGLHTYCKRPDALPPGEPGIESAFLEILRYPLFSEQADVTLYAELDPLAPFDGARSYFAFHPTDPAQGNARVATLESYLSSPTGHRFGLAPLPAGAGPTDSARLVFAERPTSDPPPAIVPVCLVPRGDFGLRPTGKSAGAPRLMTGLSGVEYVSLAPDASVLSFFPGRPAFAGGLVRGQPRDPDAALLDGRATTAWAYPSAPGRALLYRAQPGDGVFHGADAVPSPDPSFQPFAYLELPTEHLPSTPSAALSFPIFPYQGLRTDSLDLYRRVELEAAGPLRRRLTRAAGANATPAAAGSGVVRATSPQGLVAEFSTDLERWNRLVLGQSPDGQNLAFSNIARGTPLFAALQSNQLCLVVTDPGSLADHLADAEAAIRLAGWDFDFARDGWAAQGFPRTKGTILILKFHEKSLAELARDARQWADADAFTRGRAPAAQRVLSELFDDATARAETDADFAYLANTVIADPRWNGVLVLNGRVPLDEIPFELRAVAAGVDPARFFAHHFGINCSVVRKGASGQPEIQRTSMFGLIHYEADGPLVDDGEDYQFRVKSLKVRFASSLVAAFSSAVELKIDALFGEPVNLSGDEEPKNVIDLLGVYEREVLPDGTSRDHYVFRTPDGTEAVYESASAVVGAVAVRSVQLVTVQAAATAAPGTRTEARFLMSGTLDFRALPGFDLFSFGRAAGAPDPAGLAFKNLAIDMTFDPDAPGTNAFTFDASRIALDLAASQPRDASLFQHFPIRLAGMTQSSPGVTPKSLGYVSVVSPVAQSSLSDPWFSLDFDLDLGTLGALAGSAGLSAGLTAAWSPCRNGYSVYVGMKLPGAAGGKRELSLQGVLKLGFKNICLQVAGSGYGLALYDAGLSFFGVKLPPSGRIDMFLFGDPDAGGKSESLGWYMAYSKDAPKALPGGG